MYSTWVLPSQKKNDFLIMRLNETTLIFMMCSKLNVFQIKESKLWNTDSLILGFLKRNLKIKKLFIEK
jgi:hypothetical protein